MDVDILECRKLFAASSTITDGVVRVVGTDESERIEIQQQVSYQIGLKDGRRVANPITSKIRVVVDKVEIASYDTKDVLAINLFGLGGNDTIIGGVDHGRRFASSLIGGVTVGDDAHVAAVSGNSMPRLYVEGGRGNDRIAGGTGNDKLYGGRGNDRIADRYGHNLIDGGAGDDVLIAIDNEPDVSVVRFSDNGGGVRGRRITSEAVEWVTTGAAAQPTPDTIIGGEGNDAATADVGDTVVTVESITRSATPARSVVVTRFGEGNYYIGSKGNTRIELDDSIRYDRNVNSVITSLEFRNDGKGLRSRGV